MSTRGATSRFINATKKGALETAKSEGGFVANLNWLAIAELVSFGIQIFIVVASLMDISGSPVPSFNEVDTWLWLIGAALLYEVLIVGMLVASKGATSETLGPVAARFVAQAVQLSLVIGLIGIFRSRFNDTLTHFERRFDHDVPNTLLKQELATIHWTFIMFLNVPLFCAGVYTVIVSLFVHRKGPAKSF